jgi:hypothetical protein
MLIVFDSKSSLTHYTDPSEFFSHDQWRSYPKMKCTQICLRVWWRVTTLPPSPSQRWPYGRGSWGRLRSPEALKFLSQLHICIALLNILFLKIHVQKLTCSSWKLGFRGIIFSEIKDHFLSFLLLKMSKTCLLRFDFHGICSINQAQINCNLNQFETMSMCTGCTDWKMQILIKFVYPILFCYY